MLQLPSETTSKPHFPQNILSNKARLINQIGFGFAFCLLLGIFFMLGMKYSEGLHKLTAEKSDIAAIANNLQSTENVKLVSKSVDAIQWIKNNENPACNADHPIKGVSSKDPKYYLKSNKNYEKIKADICFATEEYARDTAGYVKKF